MFSVIQTEFVQFPREAFMEARIIGQNVVEVVTQMIYFCENPTSCTKDMFEMNMLKVKKAVSDLAEFKTQGMS
jgi:hypothetical protein